MFTRAFEKYLFVVPSARPSLVVAYHVASENFESRALCKSVWSDSVPGIEPHVPPPELMHVPATEKHPVDRLIPLPKVEVALPETSSLFTDTPPENVEVEFVPATRMKERDR